MQLKNLSYGANIFPYLFPPRIITSYNAIWGYFFSSALLHPSYCNTLFSVLSIFKHQVEILAVKYLSFLVQRFTCSVLWILSPTAGICSGFYAWKTHIITLLHHMKRETTLLSDMIIKYKKCNCPAPKCNTIIHNDISKVNSSLEWIPS